MRRKSPIKLTILAVAPLVVMTQPIFPVEKLTIRAEGSAPLRELRGTIGTSVSTPLGALPVSGRAVVTHSCDGTFAGVVRYSFLVRLGARLKKIALVSAIDGRVTPAPADCTFSGGPLSGQFQISDSSVTGSIRASADSLPVHGVVRAVGDTAYLVVLTALAENRADTVLANMYARR